ncbi:hypothetical protein Tco_0140329 [Tanacetum coccineum]
MKSYSTFFAQQATMPTTHDDEDLLQKLKKMSWKKFEFMASGYEKKQDKANGRNEKRIVAIYDSNSKSALVATTTMNGIELDKEFDAEPGKSKEDLKLAIIDSGSLEHLLVAKATEDESCPMGTEELGKFTLQKYQQKESRENIALPDTTAKWCCRKERKGLLLNAARTISYGKFDGNQKKDTFGYSTNSKAIHVLHSAMHPENGTAGKKEVSLSLRTSLHDELNSRFEDPAPPKKVLQIVQALYMPASSPKSMVYEWVSHYLSASRQTICLLFVCVQDFKSLQTFSDSYYAGTTSDKKITSGGFSILGETSPLGQCKKQTIVAIPSSTDGQNM